MEKGYKLVDSPDKADVVLFNTCSVRGHAEERAISNMGALLQAAGRKLQAANTKHKEKIFGIVGCTAQAMGSELFKRLPGLNLICGTGEIAKLPELIENAQCGKIISLANIDGHIPEIETGYRDSDKHAYVSIMHGCNNFCSYCIVPYVRGRERSREVTDIVKEIKELARKGIKEITLLGQNVNSYKLQASGSRPQVKRHDFTELLKIINNIEDIEEINFMTSHPKDVNVELFKMIRDSDRISKRLHLPLQSGSDRILRLMNRGYTKARYMGLIKRARDIVPGIRLTTDIIVGFPTEREGDFKDTLNLMKEVKFGMAYIFKYSPRRGTGAAGLKDDVPADVKIERHKTLLDLQRKLSFAARQLVIAFVTAFLIISPLAHARDVPKADFVKDINMLFLKEDYEALIRNAEKNLKYYRLSIKEKKGVFYLAGLSYVKLNNFTASREVFDKILDMRGDDFRQDAYIGIADSYFYESNYAGAESAYKDVLRIYPRSDRLSSVYYNLGLIYKAEGNPYTANYYFQKLKEDFGKSFEAGKFSYVPAVSGPAYYVIQLGAFRNLGNARDLVRRLRRKEYDSYIQKSEKDGRPLYKVRGGKFSNKSYAMRLLGKLRKSGFSAKVVVE